MARSYRCKITGHTLQAGTSNTYAIVFACSDLKTGHDKNTKSNYWSKTDHFSVKWTYTTGQKDNKGKTIIFPGETSTVAFKKATAKHVYTFNIPENAKSVTFNVKPVA